MSYKYDGGNNYMFHYINEDDITFICLSEEKYKISLANSFLKELKEKFYSKYS